jgi:aldehyde dehydrogenase (NAD+)
MLSNARFLPLGLEATRLREGALAVHSPIDGSLLARLAPQDAAATDAAIACSVAAFEAWRRVPAPRRGELVRRFAQALREHKALLAELVTIECGKIRSEGEGEVQEMIDICDFAVGLSRQLHGLTIASERPGHALRETWHPLGPVAVVTAFNFPVAVWAWNAAIALVCGDSLLWKPSERTPLCALACQRLLEQAAAGMEEVPRGLSAVIVGGAERAVQLADDRRVALLSATGSCAMGRALAPRVAQRLGRSLLELGGNNAVIVAPSADLELALRAIVFGAVGTAGQRCTSTRRLFVHAAVREQLLERLRAVFAGLVVGDPRAADTLVGPLIGYEAFTRMQDALAAARAVGARIHGGERVLAERFPAAWYVRPAVVEHPPAVTNSMDEVFAPLLNCFEYTELDDAIARQNAVPQGLSSAIFTTDLREAERFLSATGSDCGIANVNAGTSGAEIGGAFGGEKDTGGGREAGADAWRAYMRRMTATINYSDALPLAQGVRFTPTD